MNGGMIPSQVTGPDVPPHWGVHFAVEDADEAVESHPQRASRRAREEVLAPPADLRVRPRPPVCCRKARRVG